jgi:hypothetical protein
VTLDSGEVVRARRVNREFNPKLLFDRLVGPE